MLVSDKGVLVVDISFAIGIVASRTSNASSSSKKIRSCMTPRQVFGCQRRVGEGK